MKYILNIMFGCAVVLPVFVGAISFDKIEYSADEPLVIPNISGNGGRFYNLTIPDFVFVVNGWSEAYELPGGFLIPGEYIVADTNEPNACSTLTLAECRAQSDFVGEKSFSILLNDIVVVVEEIVIENSTTTSITADLSEEETFTASIDPVIVEEPDAIVENSEVISNDSDVMLENAIFDDLDVIREDATVNVTEEVSEPVIDNVIIEPDTTPSIIEDENTNGTITTTF